MQHLDPPCRSGGSLGAPGGDEVEFNEPHLEALSHERHDKGALDGGPAGGQQAGQTLQRER